MIIRYDPRDLAEIRVFHQDRFLCRAICQDLAAATVSLKEITAARSARRRELSRQIGERASVVDRLIAVHAPPPPAPPAAATPSAQDQPAPRQAQALPGGVTRTWTPRTSRPARRDRGSGSRNPGHWPEPPPGDADFIVTKEHRRFTEFADAVRRDRYIGLCYGPPGVGKTLSARRYACWHELEPLLQAARRHFTEGRDRADWHTLLYTPTVSATPRMIDKELTQLGCGLRHHPHSRPVRPAHLRQRPRPAAVRRAAHHRRGRPAQDHRPWSSSATTTTAASSA